MLPNSPDNPTMRVWSSLQAARPRIKELTDFLGGPGVKSPPSDAGDLGSIPGQGIGSHMPWATQRACHSEISRVPQLRPTQPNEYFLTKRIQELK